MNLDLVVITGAGRGIGRAIALEIANCGIPVFCVSKSDSVKETEAIIRSSGKIADSLILDLGDYERTKYEIGNWIKNKNYRRIGVVLAASVLGSKFEIENFNPAEWAEVMNVNLIGNFTLLGALLPRMIDNKFGRIIAFSGGGSAYAYPIFSAYSASKTAVVRTVENFAEILKEKGDFAVAALAPGAVETDMLKKVKSFGAEVKTTVDISEPVNFAREFLLSDVCNFSGRFVHVRDVWKEHLNNENEIDNNDKWKLRRIEK
jgi:NAD(P)-dependent dehydrogenase (short-subunit alcohol dehydrogenase family)